MSTQQIEHPHAHFTGGRRLDGKAALVVGADGELGRRVATALGHLGASVALVHRGHRRDVVDALLRQVPSASALECEPSRSADVEALFERLGAVDIVVHTPGQVLKKPFAEISDAEFEDNLDANVRAAFHVLREAARRLSDGGRIVTFSTSITGVTIPFYGAYAGHKAATEHYVRALAKELGPRGITVNAVAPGPINSPFYFGVETEESFRMASRLSGAGRLGEWDEIVPAVAFLCSPDAQWITGQTIRVNGGMTA